ncbi:MAG: alpha/beta fold hydrolase [Chitinophagaceae bacterium]|nr:alpha/beta fold hydrolase [Chitinophagaceae bacterium]
MEPLFFRSIGTGKPIIILHGLFGSSDNWLTVTKPLLDHNYQLIIPDMRNHGQSFHHTEHTIESMAGDIFRLISDQSISFPHIIGHSMGGKVAMRFALDFPKLLDKLIVVDMTPRKYAIQHYATIDALKSIDLQTLDSRKTADDILSRFLFDVKVRQFLLKNIYFKENRFQWKLNIEALEKHLDNMSAALPFSGPFPNPTLFLRGELSDYVRDEDIAHIQTMFLDATIKTIEGADHWIHATKPEEFIKEILLFLNSQ